MLIERTLLIEFRYSPVCFLCDEQVGSCFAVVFLRDIKIAPAIYPQVNGLIFIDCILKC